MKSRMVCNETAATALKIKQAIVNPLAMSVLYLEGFTAIGRYKDGIQLKG